MRRWPGFAELEPGEPRGTWASLRLRARDGSVASNPRSTGAAR